MSLFGIDLAGEINNQLGSLLLPVTLTKVAAGSRTSSSLTGGVNPISTAYSCRGFIEDYSEYSQANGLVQVGERKVTILGGSLSAGIIPEPNDRVTIEGVEYYITGPIIRDPAGATYTCKVKG